MNRLQNAESKTSVLCYSGNLLYTVYGRPLHQLMTAYFCPGALFANGLHLWAVIKVNDDDTGNFVAVWDGHAFSATSGLSLVLNRGTLLVKQFFCCFFLLLSAVFGILTFNPVLVTGLQEGTEGQLGHFTLVCRDSAGEQLARGGEHVLVSVVHTEKKNWWVGGDSVWRAWSAF